MTQDIFLTVNAKEYTSLFYSDNLFILIRKYFASLIFFFQYIYIELLQYILVITLDVVKCGRHSAK